MKTTTSNNPPANKPKVTKRAANDRGRSELGWLHSRHTFSFGTFFNPDHMGFRSLRVINDDVVAPSQGFGQHPHRDAEIFSYVIDGELEHKDSMGNGRVIKAGDLQYMSAGHGVLHSEFNPSAKRPVHFLQVWLRPNVTGGEPRYADKALSQSAKKNQLTLVFAKEPNGEAICVRADADVYFGRLDAGREIVHRPQNGSAQWLHVISGELVIAGESFNPGDGGSFENFTALQIVGKSNAEFLLFDLN